jgi:hypothetical protein
LPEPDETAPLAIGGAPDRDPHIIPTLMASVVAAEAGWRTMNLGPSTPFHTFQDACEAYEPELMWMALKSRIPKNSRKDFVDLVSDLAATGTTVALGGRAVAEVDAKWPKGVHVLSSMTDLSGLVVNLRNHNR